MAVTTVKWSFSVPLFNEFPQRSPVVELLAKWIGNKKEERNFFDPRAMA